MLGNIFLKNLRAHKDAEHKIIFTNGVFDILHSGHIHLLQQARTYGEVLVVGINSDSSVIALEKDKDPTDPGRPLVDRPINTAKDRACVLDALECVDYVVIYEDLTPLLTIKQIMPDVLIKGKDWDDKGVVGRDVVEENGGEVVTLELLSGYSTIDLIERCWRAFNEG